MSPTPLPPVHLYQLAYSQETLARIEPGYRVLDNLENSRPDWYEYWAIRRFLLNETLQDDAFYGFFSPKFGRKRRIAQYSYQSGRLFSRLSSTR